MLKAQIRYLYRPISSGQAESMAISMSARTAHQWYARGEAKRWRCAAAPEEVQTFHQSLPGYAPTPLVEAPTLARELGVARVLVKDESARLALASFKVLGASWAISRALSSLVENDISSNSDATSPVTFARLRTLAHSLGRTELVTATEGNHGQAVARVATVLGLPAHIWVPNVVPPDAIASIRSEGATVTVTAASYDKTVIEAAAYAADTGGVLVQDTSWSGYEQIPGWIVEGYSTLFREIDTQLHAADAFPAGLVAIPIGVGSLTQAAIMHYRSALPTAGVTVLGVEPDAAPCVLRSLVRGHPAPVPTATTNMTGLNCGTPSKIAWPYLEKGLDAAITVADHEAARAVDDLAAIGIASGPSGAASLAGVRAALLGAADRRTLLNVTDGTSLVLLSTEGRARH
jgi:diaminopropionate ammonia-lyase